MLKELKVKKIIKCEQSFGKRSLWLYFKGENQTNFDSNNNGNYKNCWLGKNDNQTMDQRPLKKLMRCETFVAFWNKLIIHIHDQRTIDNIHHLQESFYKCNMKGGKTIVKYHGNIEMIIN